MCSNSSTPAGGGSAPSERTITTLSEPNTGGKEVTEPVSMQEANDRLIRAMVERSLELDPALGSVSRGSIAGS
jgi:hypothetical protein